MSFPFERQTDAMDCGPACLQMVARFHGKKFSLPELRERCYITREGVSFLGISEAAESIGLRTLGLRIPFSRLAEDTPLPCIVHWRQKHFVVVYKIKKGVVHIADPARGLVKYSVAEFEKNWAMTVVDEKKLGLVMILQPTPSFYDQEETERGKTGFGFLMRYINLYKRYFFQISLGLLIGSIIQLIFPFLTQAVIDIGINTSDLAFIYLVLFAQLALVIGRMTVEFVRGWLLLHISTRVNVAIVSAFLHKLMALPMSYFDKKLSGDLLQRIEDNQRIESFLSNTSLSVMFSFVNLLIFGIVLAIYNLTILLVFLAGTILYLAWVAFFMRSRARLDHRRFKQLSDNNAKLIDIITGMQEIKLTQSETSKRWDWENLQASLFKTRVKAMSLSQYQLAGGRLINEVSNVLITIIAAMAVLSGSMTLGMMLAVQFIIGQLNIPVNQMVVFFRTAQDARMSLDRLAEVHSSKLEESEDEMKVKNLPSNKSIYINSLSFQYEGPRSPFVLKDIDIVIPEKKVTAVVGTSGSGKTTLLKLILGFYEPVEGDIMIGDTNLRNLSLKIWRQRVGVVMQDGYIFPDTIANNIAPGIDVIDSDKLLQAVTIANINNFIDILPLGINTRIGHNGHGLSQGQKQRILIARALYKDPEYLFFDEATNSLDAANEKQIVANLDKFFSGKTVMVIAHRLSTVRKADNIVVIDKGRMIENGTHHELIEKKGIYFNLVRDQLELGN
ncbi:MAG TPA: peptidase domain-containing ABC transporter [Bacteroidetes bacterium]|nr:peptidase domain-containing ABC transporter [Bacteroidota bacterium]